MPTERQCALCKDLYSPKEVSHIVPSFVYKWHKKTSVTGFMRFSQSVNQRSQDGLKDYFLCEKCEDRFMQFETTFATKIFHPYVKDNAVCVDYDEFLLKFTVSASWRVLAYHKEKGNLAHFRGRHEDAVAETLGIWCSYLLGTRDDIGCHEIHMLPWCGVTDHTASNVPDNINRYLRRAIEISVMVGDNAASTYCKLGPMIIIGLIKYPNLHHWNNTKILKHGRFTPMNWSAPDVYQDYIFAQSRANGDANAGISERQMKKIEKSYDKNLDRFIESDTYKSLALDLELKNKARSKGESGG